LTLIQRILRNVLHIQNFNVYLLFYLDTQKLLATRESFGRSRDTIAWAKLYYNWIHS